jgi:hypothetical protein
MNIAAFFRFRRDPARTIPNKPKPCICIQKATIGRPGEENGVEFRALEEAVLIVKVDEAPLAPGVGAVAENAQLAFAGSPLQLNLTELLKAPPTGATLIA